MSLDNCLNKDVHELVAQHVMLSRAYTTDEMYKNDPRIFSLTTPAKNVSNTYRRVWNESEGGVGPSSKRIVQDINKAVDAIKLFAKHEGAFVPGIAQRPGDRHIVNEMKSKIWGGKRTKKEVCAMLFSDMEDLHKDLLQLVEKE